MLQSSECLIDVEVAARVAENLIRRHLENPHREPDAVGLAKEVTSALREAAAAPVAAGGIRPLLSLDAADVREDRPDLDDVQVEAVLNADWGHLADTEVLDIVRRQVAEKAETLFPFQDAVHAGP